MREKTKNWTKEARPGVWSKMKKKCVGAKGENREGKIFKLMVIYYFPIRY